MDTWVWVWVRWAVGGPRGAWGRGERAVWWVAEVAEVNRGWRSSSPPPPPPPPVATTPHARLWHALATRGAKGGTRADCVALDAARECLELGRDVAAKLGVVEEVKIGVELDEVTQLEGAGLGLGLGLGLGKKIREAMATPPPALSPNHLGGERVRQLVRLQVHVRGHFSEVPNLVVGEVKF